MMFNLFKTFSVMKKRDQEIETLRRVEYRNETYDYVKSICEALANA